MRSCCLGLPACLPFMSTGRHAPWPWITPEPIRGDAVEIEPGRRACIRAHSAQEICRVQAALQPYFRGSIFKNWPHGESFWRFELANRVDQSCYGAKWVVLPICCTFDSAKRAFYRNDRTLRSFGCVPVHISKGSMFFAGRQPEPTNFVIYHLASLAKL